MGSALDQLISAVSDPNPFTHISSYIQARDKKHPTIPHLFLLSNGHRPSRQWFLQQAHKTTSKFLRRGGATYYSHHNLPASYIKQQGRWSSRAWKLYVSRHPYLFSNGMSTLSVPPPIAPLARSRECYSTAENDTTPHNTRRPSIGRDAPARQRDGP